MTHITKIHNATTGEVIEREMTDIEITELENAQASAAKYQKELSDKAAAKQEALAKLAALGLTTDDLKALGLGGN